MYPLNAILIGVDEDWLPHVRRELAICSVDVAAEFPRSPQVIPYLWKERGERRLLVYRVASSQDLDFLTRLTASLPGWPVLGLVGGHPHGPNDSATGDLISLTRAGVSQFVSLPPRTTDLKEALDRITVQFLHHRDPSFIIAVGGVVGGCGATTIAINIADQVVQRHGRECVLVDLSLKMGMIADRLGISPKHSILDLLRDVERLDTLTAERALSQVGVGGFKVLAGPSELDLSASVMVRDVAKLLGILSQITDVIVLDVPSTYDEIYFEALATASQTVLVGNQTLSSVRALKFVHEAVSAPQKAGQNHQIVINRYDASNSTFSADRLLKPVGVDSLMTIASDNAATSAASLKGCTLRLSTPKSQALADIVSLTGKLMSPEDSTSQDNPGILGRIRRALSNA